MRLVYLIVSDTKVFCWADHTTACHFMQHSFLLVFDCSVDRIGDNICDSENNVDLCNYDGGDCCPADVSVGCLNCEAESCACHETGLTSCFSKLNLFITQKLIDQRPFLQIVRTMIGSEMASATT